MRPLDTFIEQPVRSLQTMLRVIALDQNKSPILVPDGIYGPLTMYAVTAFQRQYQLPVTGITDLITWRKITEIYRDASIRQGNAQPIEIIMNPGKTYRYGDSSPYLYLLQAMLAELSDDHPTIPRPSLNGVMDEDTSASVKGFQKLSNLPQTGEADKVTWKNITLQFTLNAHNKDQLSDNSL